MSQAVYIRHSLSIKSSHAIAILLVLIWLVAMGYLLWYFEVLRFASGHRLYHYDSRTLPAPPGSSLRGPRALYFLTGNCRCSAAALDEVRRLQGVAGSRLQQFIIADDSVPVARIAALDAHALSAREQALWRRVLPRTPSVALWDRRGTLVYFGPIALSADCGARHSYLVSAWQRLAGGEATAFASWDVVACTCPSSGTT